MNFKYSKDNADQSFFKRNYVDTLNIITPKIYIEEDLALSGIKQSPIDLVLKSHINLAKNIQSVFNVANLGEGASFQDISGVSKYFIKQNNVASITAKEFDEKILYELGASISDFKTEAEFKAYISEVLLPNIRLNNFNFTFNQSSYEATHSYLLENLGWMYVLNTSANGGLAYYPSSLIVDEIVNNLYYGGEITLNESLKDVTRYIWKNYSTCSLFRQKELIPPMFLSGTGKYVSGTQQLDNLCTLIDVLYSPLVSDSKDYRVRDAFMLYAATSSFSIQTEPAGPFSRFLKSISYSLFDVNDQINKLNYLYDLDRCPEEFLPRVADLIGWDLIGNDPKKWRIQIRNAVSIYQLKGTKAGILAALNSVFGSDSINLSTDIEELYESYVPNLLYYLLVTESNLLQNFSTWTLQTAQSLGIKNYSTENLDVNVRFVVDQIIEDSYKLYPQNFFTGTIPFDPKAKYKYRGVIHKIPPWESIKYYRYCKLDLRLVNYLCQRLESFGVNSSLVESFRYLIESNTYKSANLFSVKSNWLIFTKEKYQAPNRNNLITNYKSDKLKYIPLWNAKSSSFNISLRGADFSFVKYSNNFFSFNGLKSIIKSIKDLSPAHSIPLVDLSLSDEDLVAYNECVDNSISYTPTPDFMTASSNHVGYSKIALNMSSLSGTFSRQQVNTLQDTVFVLGSSISNVPRNSIRRRNFQNNLPKTGWYDRTGFNMPGVLLPDQLGYNTYIPLGLIPSTGKFTTISSYHDLPAVYGGCENLRSGNTYNGIITSSTFPCRGTTLDFCNPLITYSTRDECDDIIILMHRKMQERVLAEAEDLVATNSTNLSPYVYNIARSIANSSSVTQLPNSKNDFFSFEFGRKINQLYLSYIKDFGYHDITRNTIRDRGGLNILAHTYGPILYNSFFIIQASAATTYPQLVTSSYTDDRLLNIGAGSGLFSPLAAASGTSSVTAISSLIIQTPEFRNRQIVKGVEFIMPSGSSEQNYFMYADIDPVYETEDSDDFAIDNPIIKFKNKSSPGLPRLKINLKTFGPSANYFLPEHKFNVEIPYFVGNDSGTRFGGNGIGVWIHTEPEGDYIWSWTPNGEWVINNIYDLTSQYITLNLAHQSYIPLKVVDKEDIGAPLLSPNKQAVLSLKNIKKNLFKTLSIEFNTYNSLISIPDYYPARSNVHRSNQSYSIEVFMFPDSQGQTYTILDYINAVDLTLKEKAGTFTEEELQDTFLFFRSLALGLGSRVAATTSGTFELSGGSRMDHIYHPKFGPYTQAANGSYSEIDIS